MLSYKEPWWRQYRQKKYKPKFRLNTEQIIRKSIKEATVALIRNTSLAGIKQIIARNTSHLNRVIRIGLFFAMLIGTWYYLTYVWFGLLTNPLVVSTESATYPIQDIDFPAVALCNVNRISRKAMREYSKYPILARQNESIEEVEWFLEQMGRLIDFSVHPQLQNHPFLDVAIKKSSLVEQRMKELAPKCEEMLIACMWAANNVDCMSIFQVRRTIHGHCCVFNYVLEFNSGFKRPARNKTKVETKRQVIPGGGYGLTVILDPLLEDYAYQMGNLKGIEVILFDPTHFAETKSGGRVIQGFVQPDEMALFELKSTKQQAASEVRKHSLATRKCLFHDEYQSEYGDMYSYSACLLKCRMRTIQSLCKCTPYFYPVSAEEEPLCTLDNLNCLNKYREKFMYLYPFEADSEEGLEIEIEDSLYCPECYPDCEFTKHLSRSTKVPFVNVDSGKYVQNSLINFANLTSKSILFVHQGSSDGILDRLDVVSYWFEIISNAGGYSSILLGFSQIALVEILFYYSIFLIRIMVKNFRKFY